MSSSERDLRLFLDAGVIVEGCSGEWGFAKAVLILATLRPRYTIVLAEQIAREVASAESRKWRISSPAEAATFASNLAGWFARVRLERLPSSANSAIERARLTILLALRHLNDLPAVVAAMEAQPDWVISTNRAHWNDDLAARSGLRIATPLGPARLDVAYNGYQLPRGALQSVPAPAAVPSGRCRR